jgi:manganese/zinc/iron transport system substrate-binding protein
MVRDIATAVAGERAEVKGIMGEGVDPHLYTPTRSDVQLLQAADIVFYVGLLLEGKMSDTLVRIASGGREVYPVTDIMDRSFLLESETYEGLFDPHVWMDVSAWAEAVDAVSAKLGQFDPENAEYYQANAAEYRAQLEELDSYVQRVIGSIPEQQRVLVTAHDAFQYFGRAYGIDVRGIQGLSTESEAGLEDINSLVSFLVQNDIGAVFVETSVADKNVRALIEGAAAQDHEVRIGGELFSDAMGEPGTYRGTYIGMIDHNATVIARALGGEAPAAGLNGNL